MIGTVEEWRDYAERRGLEAVATASDEAAGASLARASDYIQAHYISRVSVVPFPYPQEWVEATYIAALAELERPQALATQPKAPTAGRALVGVGSIRWQVTGDTGSAQGGDHPRISQIDAIFEPWMRPQSPMFSGMVV